VNCYCVTQVEEILNEVKFSHYIETGECKTDIDLPDFVKCNHRYSGYFLCFTLTVMVVMMMMTVMLVIMITMTETEHVLPQCS